MQESHILCNHRSTGIDYLKEVPWGTHICGFYQTKKDLLDILIPFFKAGLENNEYCVWVVSEPLDILEARRALEDTVLNFNSHYNEYFTLMLDELDRANGIISEYLSLSRNHDINLHKENINNIISALIPLLQADAIEEDKRIDLELGNIEDLYINPTEIRQVILNLVRNGLESMEAGGIMKIGTYKEETSIVLEISDSGNGIPDHIIKNLGTPFLTTKENGTGLGLSICLNILNRQNAKMNVESSASGTSFFIRFPSNERLQ